MKLLLTIGLWSLAAVANAETQETNCYQVWEALHCDVRLEPKPPARHQPQAASETQPCRDASGKLAPCPATTPKHCQDANGHATDCAAPGAKPT